MAKLVYVLNLGEHIKQNHQPHPIAQKQLSHTRMPSNNFFLRSAFICFFHTPTVRIFLLLTAERAQRPEVELLGAFLPERRRAQHVETWLPFCLRCFRTRTITV